MHLFRLVCEKLQTLLVAVAIIPAFSTARGTLYCACLN